MTIYEHLYSFFAGILGTVEAATVQGEVFCQYASYLCIGLLIYGLIKLCTFAVRLIKL